MSILNKFLKTPEDPTYNPAWHLKTSDIANLAICFIIFSIVIIVTNVPFNIFEFISYAFTLSFFVVKITELRNLNLYKSRLKPIIFELIQLIAVLLIATLLETVIKVSFVLCLIPIVAAILFYHGKKFEAARKNIDRDTK